MENNENLGTGLLVLACAAAGAALGAISGAFAMTTEKGRQADSHLGHAYGKAKSKLPEISSMTKSLKLLK